MKMTLNSWLSIASNVISIISFIIIYAVLTKKRIPVVSNEKAAFYILFVLGFCMSVLSGYRHAPDGKFSQPAWVMNPLMIGGFLAFVVLIVKIFGIKIPFMPGYREAVIVMSGIIIFKWIVTRVYYLLHRVM